MTREEAITVLKGLSDNPLFSNLHKVAFSIAIHDMKAYHDWNINNLILVNKDNYEPLEQEPKPMVEIDLYSVIKQKYIEREVLDKIRAEVENINVWGMRYNPDTDKDRKPQIVQKVKEHVIEILDKYKAETEEV